MATLRTRVAERYRALSLRFHRETPDRRAARPHGGRREGRGRRVLAGAVRGGRDRADAARAGRAGRDRPGASPSWASSCSRRSPCMNRIFARRMEEPTRLAQERIGEVSAVAHESIDGALVVKTLGREDAETRRLLREGARLARRAGARRRDPGHRSRRRSTHCPTMAIALLLAVGSWRVSSGAITLGDLVGFVALFQLLSWPMRFIGWILAELPRAVVGYDRLEEVFREPVTVTPATRGHAASRRTARPARARPSPAVRTAGAGARGRDVRGRARASRSRSWARPASARARSPS